MEMPNAIKVCRETGSFVNCPQCPLYDVCCKDYPNTEEFEKAVESAAIEYLKGKESGNDIR